jgi:hypothetical protein
MRRLGVIIAAIVLAYGIDIAFFRGKYSDATFQVASRIKHHLLGR